MKQQKEFERIKESFLICYIRKFIFEEYSENLQWRFLNDEDANKIIGFLLENNDRYNTVFSESSVPDSTTYFIQNQICYNCTIFDFKPEGYDEIKPKSSETEQESVSQIQNKEPDMIFDYHGWFNASIEKIKLLKPERGGYFVIPASVLPDQSLWQVIVDNAYELGFLSAEIVQNGIQVEL